jgi:hypothetical protein
VAVAGNGHPVIDQLVVGALKTVNFGLPATYRVRFVPPVPWSYQPKGVRAHPETAERRALRECDSFIYGSPPACVKPQRDWWLPPGARTYAKSTFFSPYITKSIAGERR